MLHNALCSSCARLRVGKASKGSPQPKGQQTESCDSGQEKCDHITEMITLSTSKTLRCEKASSRYLPQARGEQPEPAHGVNALRSLRLVIS